MARFTDADVGEFSWELVDGPDVPPRLQADVTQALENGEAVSLKAMQVMLDDATEPIISQLIAAAQDNPEQAAKIDLQIDSFSLVYGYKPEHEVQRPHLVEAVKTLQALGTTALFTNPYFGPPHRHFLKEVLRDHRKAHTAGDVLWLGPSNFHKENFDDSEIADFMLRTKNDKAANLIRSIFSRDAHNRWPERNHTFRLNDANYLLLDGGMPSSSYILHTAHQLIADMDQAEPALMTTQYYPTRKIARQLHNNSEAIASWNSSKALNSEGLGLLTRLVQVLETTGPDVEVAKPTTYMHAKSLSLSVKPNSQRDLFPDHEGRIGLIGTHNLNRLGVLAGTQELMLVTTDTDLLDQHARWVKTKTA